MGCDIISITKGLYFKKFQSTQPEWAATDKPSYQHKSIAISIHAARVGCDQRWTRWCKNDTYFNPRSPSGLRLFAVDTAGRCKQYFNPRSPSGLRLWLRNALQVSIIFQSTQPEWAATFAHSDSSTVTQDFNPRSPSGLRQSVKNDVVAGLQFQSTQPEWAATVPQYVRTMAEVISIHAARVGCDKCSKSNSLAFIPFQSTQPEWAATKCYGRCNNRIYHFNPRSPSGLRQ